MNPEAGMTLRLSHKSEPDDLQLLDYLLGLLPPEQAERLDEWSISEDDVAARLRSVEHDLIDAYVRGTLDGDTRQRFESHYLTSPRRREQVAFARRLVPAVDRAAEAAAGRRWTAAASRTATRVAAAALLLAAGGAVLFQATRRETNVNVAQRDVAIAGSDRSGREDRDVARNADTKTGNESARVSEPAGPASRPAPVIALLLPQTRSVASVPALTVPPGADQVVFELRLDSKDFPRYQAGLRDPATNDIVWRSGWIDAGSSTDQPSVRVAVPARVLKPQHYTLDLTGRGTAGPEVAGSYVFEIMAR